MFSKPQLWNLEIHPLDVGHGDSSLVLFYQGYQLRISILIDGGHGYNSKLLKEKLKEKLPVNGVLDVVIITHFDIDHWKGIEKLVIMKRKPFIKSGHTIFFTQCPITFLSKYKDTGKNKNLEINKEKEAEGAHAQEEVKDTNQAREFMELLQKKKFTIHSKHDSVLGKSIWDFLPGGKTTKEESERPDLKFIAMNKHVIEKENEDPQKLRLLEGGPGTKKNHGSISCLISLNDFYHLTSGDICEAQEIGIKKYLEAKDIKLTGLKISHHGSYTSSSEDFLKINCAYAIISHGLDKGCPSPSVLARIFRSPIQTCYLTNKYDAMASLMHLISEEDVNKFLRETKTERLQLSKDLSEFVDLFSKLSKSDIEAWCQENPDSLRCSSDENEKTDIRSTFESQKSLVSNLLKHLDEIEVKNKEEKKESEEAKKGRISKEVNELTKELKELSEIIFLRKFLHLVKKEQEGAGQVQQSTAADVTDIEKGKTEGQETQPKDQNKLEVGGDKAQKDKLSDSESTEKPAPNSNDLQTDNIESSEIGTKKIGVDTFLRKSENLMEKFSDLVAKVASSLSSWDRFRNKMVVAGDPINKTASYNKNKQPRGNILIQVKSMEEGKTQFTIKYDGQKKKKEKIIEDKYLLLSKADIETLFKNYISEAQSKRNGLMLKLNDQLIGDYKDIFKSDFLNGILKDKCSITFRSKDMGNDLNKTSLQLQHGSKHYKIKYFYVNSKNPLDQNRALIRRVNL